MDKLNAVLDNLMKVGIGDTAEAKIILQAVIDDLNFKRANKKSTDFQDWFSYEAVITNIDDEIKELQAAMGRLSG